MGGERFRSPPNPAGERQLIGARSSLSNAACPPDRDIFNLRLQGRGNVGLRTVAADALNSDPGTSILEARNMTEAASATAPTESMRILIIEDDREAAS